MLTLHALCQMEEVARGNRGAWLQVEQVTVRLEYQMEEVRPKIWVQQRQLAQALSLWI